MHFLISTSISLSGMNNLQCTFQILIVRAQFIIYRETLTSFTVSFSFYYWPPINSSHKMVNFCWWSFWGLSPDQIVGSTEINNVLFLIEPTILVSLILAFQEISCPLFCSLLYFMLNIPISKTLFAVTQLVWFKVSLVRSRPTDVRLAQTLTLRVYPVLPVSNLT